MLMSCSLSSDKKTSLKFNFMPYRIKNNMLKCIENGLLTVQTKASSPPVQNVSYFIYHLTYYKCAPQHADDEY